MILDEPESCKTVNRTDNNLWRKPKILKSRRTIKISDQMKNFTLSSVIVVLLLLGFQAQSQIKYGVKAGVNLSNIGQNLKDSEDEMDTKMRPGIHFGATFEFNITNKVLFQPGLMFTSKGFKSDADYVGDGYDKFKFHYIEIPLHLAYKINSQIQAYAGPFVAVGIGGVNKWDIEGEKDSEKLKPFYGAVGEGDVADDEWPYHGLDFGLNFGVGYQVGPVLVNVGYSLGLGNFTAKYDDPDSEEWRKDNKYTQKVIVVSASYFIGQ